MAALTVAGPEYSNSNAAGGSLRDSLTQLSAQQKLGRPIAAKDQRQLRQAAVQMVSQVFFAPLMAELRKMEIGSKFGSGGRAEEVFGEQLDLRISDTVSAANPGGFVAKLADKLASSAAKKAAGMQLPAASWKTELAARPQVGGDVAQKAATMNLEAAR